MLQIFSIFILSILVSSPVFSQDNSARPAGFVQCKVNEQGSLGRIWCFDGKWPGQADPPALDIANNFRQNLYLKNVALNADQFQPIPALNGALTSLVLERISSTDNAGKTVRFPWRSFTERISRGDIKVIRLEKLELGAINEDDFEGFSGLMGLSISDCNVVSVHSRAFSPFSAGPSGGALREFELKDEKSLTSFPWDSLQFFSNSLQAVTLTGDSSLSSITLAPNTGMSLNKLRKVDIQNTKLKLISREIVKTFNGTTFFNNANPRASIMQVEVIFKDNQNRCGSCELDSLIDWVRWGYIPEFNRMFTTSCVKNDAGEVDYNFGFSKDFWMAFPNYDCQGPRS